MYKAIHIATLIVLLLNTIGALAGGLLLMYAPDGSLLAMPLHYLQHTPFSNFFIPGIILFTCNGLTGIVTTLYTFAKRGRYAGMVFAQGTVLCGWILSQVLLLHTVYFLHIVMAATGFFLVLAAIALYSKQNKSGTRNPTVLFLSLLMAALIIVVSLTGLTDSEFYSVESTGWKLQAIGQDFIDLLLVTPALLVTAILAFYQKRGALSFWAGVVLYLAYTFVIYCFDVHFNRLFLAYCLLLGLSFYCCLYYLYNSITVPFKITVRSKVNAATGMYFMFIGCLFYLLWLSEILPATITGIIPLSLQQAGLYTNPVHVLDIAILLPALSITGVLLLKNNSAAKAIVIPLLFFFVLMDITIGFLSWYMALKNNESAGPAPVIMGALAVVSTGFLIFNVPGHSAVHEVNHIAPQQAS